MIPDLHVLQNFRNTLYGCFSKRGDALFNLLDALSSFAHHCDSVVQLSKAPCFERQYTSITDAIADGLPYAQWSHALRCFHKAAGQTDEPYRFLLDVTHQPRPFARKLHDKTIVHAPNPTPGNKPIAIGHSYAIVAQLPQDSLSLNKHWVLPLAAQRVKSDKKGNEIGLQQVKTLMQELTLTDKLCISIGDSLYGTQECRRLAVAEPNLVHLFRLNSKRNVFSPPEAASQGKGRKQEYGDKMVLSDTRTHPPHTSQITLPWQGKHKSGQVVITCWQNRLLRGTRQFRSALHPIDLIQLRVIDDNGEPLFKRPLWLAVLGQRRHEVSLENAYHSYLARYDIEHFFRFGKNKLLLDAYQTSDVSHEENWWQLVMLAYQQLYLARTAVKQCPEPWEKYLPEYNDPANETLATPAQTQRAFQTVLNTIGTPAADCKARGKSPGRQAGQTGTRRDHSAIIFKTATAKAVPNQSTAILSTSEITAIDSNAQKIAELLSLVQTRLKKLNLTPQDFVKSLLDSS